MLQARNPGGIVHRHRAIARWRGGLQNARLRHNDEIRELRAIGIGSVFEEAPTPEC